MTATLKRISMRFASCDFAVSLFFNLFKLHNVHTWSTTHKSQVTENRDTYKKMSTDKNHCDQESTKKLKQKNRIVVGDRWRVFWKAPDAVAYTGKTKTQWLGFGVQKAVAEKKHTTKRNTQTQTFMFARAYTNTLGLASLHEHTHSHTSQQHSTQLVSFVRSLSLAWYFTSLLPWTGSENERKKDRSTVVYGSGDGGSNIFHQLLYTILVIKTNKTERTTMFRDFESNADVLVCVCVCVSAA